MPCLAYAAAKARSHVFLSALQGKLPYGATLLSTSEAKALLVKITVLTCITRKKNNQQQYLPKSPAIYQVVHDCEF